LRARTTRRCGRAPLRPARPLACVPGCASSHRTGRPGGWRGGRLVSGVAVCRRPQARGARARRRALSAWPYHPLQQAPPNKGPPSPSPHPTVPRNQRPLNRQTDRHTHTHGVFGSLVAGARKKATKGHHKATCHKATCRKATCHKATCHKATATRPHHKAICHKSTHKATPQGRHKGTTRPPQIHKATTRAPQGHWKAHHKATTRPPLSSLKPTKTTKYDPDSPPPRTPAANTPCLRPQRRRTAR
jgi:hypothetical protein